MSASSSSSSTQASASGPHKASTQANHQAPRCPHHTNILNLSRFPSDALRGQDVLGRFLMEGPDEQPAVFIRPDNDKVSIAKGCTCAVKVDRMATKL